MEKFIRQMKPDDRVALYELGADQLYLLQDFTSDPNALQLALIRGKEYIPVVFPRSQVEPRDMDTHTMNAMHMISDRLVRLPGRKNLIWLSTGFPPDDGFSKAAVTTLEKMDNAAKSLGNADFPLFAIDGAGLTVDPKINIGGGGGGGGGGGDMGSGVDGLTAL
jgi:VWFA-related protein